MNSSLLGMLGSPTRRTNPNTCQRCTKRKRAPGFMYCNKCMDELEEKERNKL